MTDLAVSDPESLLSISHLLFLTMGTSSLVVPDVLACSIRFSLNLPFIYRDQCHGVHVSCPGVIVNLRSEREESSEAPPRPPESPESIDDHRRHVRSHSLYIVFSGME